MIIIMLDKHDKAPVERLGRLDRNCGPACARMARLAS